MEVYWLEQDQANVPRSDDWLGANELAFQERLRFKARRASWRLGRWTAKRALAIYFNWPDALRDLAEIEIRQAFSGAPEVFFENKLAELTISLSHRNGTSICAVALGAIPVGCDLELIEPHGHAFITDYFTEEEQALIAGQPPKDQSRLVTLLWSAKESALKALHEGLRLDTRSVIVAPVSFERHGWTALEVCYTGRQIFHGWWRAADNMVRTLVAAPPPEPPTLLMTLLQPSQSRPSRSPSANPPDWGPT
jgi:phosphopantetheinyl transferase